MKQAKTKETITNSRVAAYRRCPRYHRIKYVDKLVPVSNLSPKRDWGTVFHAALEHYHRENASDLGVTLGLGAIEQSQLDPYAKSASFAVFIGYVTRWGDADRANVCIHVEKQFVSALTNPDSSAESRLFQLAGKMDALSWNADDQREWIIEHKTTSANIEPGSIYWERTRIDSQISTYVDGAATLGHDVAGVIYDAIKRPGHEPKMATPVELRKYTIGMGCKICGGGKGKAGSGTVAESHCNVCDGTGWKKLFEKLPDDWPGAVPAHIGYDSPRLHAVQRENDETPEEFALRIADEIAKDPSVYYQRQAVVRFDGEMTNARRDLWQVVQAMRASERTGTDYRNPDACTAYHSVCEYMPLCTGAASPDDPTRYVRLESAHSELVLPTSNSRERAQDNASSSATATI